MLCNETYLLVETDGGVPPGLDFLFFDIKSGRLCTLDQPYPL